VPITASQSQARALKVAKGAEGDRVTVAAVAAVTVVVTVVAALAARCQCLSIANAPSVQVLDWHKNSSDDRSIDD
jgi:hypothetical protein